ncbi:MAG TPA: glycogen debranching protein GlgX [Acidobacteriaceae bacterium]|nr:glycogen debranching protein GlgX [Acidobacteriaceae bacterium]
MSPSTLACPPPLPLQARKDTDGLAGQSSPLGATVAPGGVNFSVFSRHASRVELLLFDAADEAAPSRVLELDPATNRTLDYWHVFVPGIASGQVYGFRVQGPFDPSSSMRFDPEKLLLDPCGRSIAVPANYSRTLASVPGDNAATAMKSVVLDPHAYNWEGDAPLHHPAARSIIYEMHVRGFTQHPGSGVSDCKRGTYAGVIEKIPYLIDLGITAVELLPVFQFDPQSAPDRLTNYWGYQPISFFAPHCGYSSRRDPCGPADEFRDMVKALHRAGIEVILDVVFNHTAEGDHTGPTLSFRGFENGVYYTLQNDPSRYENYSGTGNTLNANHPIVRRMIVDSLHYWVEEMHVDGFRFDLASILSRDESGNLMSSPPVLWDIDSDPVLAGTKLIAEAWDAAGLYQVGSFPGHSWREWNGRFRDDLRSFFRGDQDTVGRLADRLIGSPRIYAHKAREAEQSVNFVTCHDGFTLNDLVSYSEKHNQANGENGRDGSDDNRSFNWGVEGPSDDPAIESLRARQVKNFLAVTMLSLGLPMLLMGDEMRRSQRGNNNAWCHDSDVSWLDWNLLAKHRGLHRFVKLLNRHRLLRTDGAADSRLSLNELLQRGTLTWHGVRLAEPDWGPDSHSLALCIACPSDRLAFHLMLNAYSEPLAFELPLLSEGEQKWRRWIDTGLDSPNDIVDWPEADEMQSLSYPTLPRSVVVLFRTSA